MTSENRDIPQQVLGYVARSRHYLENAYISLERNEVEKAGEFLWGSMAQAIKAVAASKGRQLRHQREVGEYLMELSKALRDPGLRDAFRDANSLHQNFYESGLNRAIVLEYGERIRPAVGRLLRLIPREMLEQ
ncbi:MAG: hypothetical protein FJ316_05225 [SAR202 cluster bacterium]|nr:hypothetical protein [SAR202 cluster bacterium]